MTPMMLQTAQKDRLRAILDPDSQGFYKVLVLDESTKKIISPLLRSNDLRSLGVVAFFMIHGPRQRISDMPAVYFLAPTAANLKRIAEDICNNDVYGAYFLNFTTSISRSDLETLALSVGSHSKGNLVHSISDQFLDFVALAGNIFTLNREKALLYYDIQPGAEKDISTKPSNRLNKTMYSEETALSLFSVFKTIDQVPYILADSRDPSSPASNLAANLNSTFRNINIVKKTRKRPLLIILDRSFDFVTPSKHGWAYNSLLADILGLKLNKIFITPQEPFDLADDDLFWKKNSSEAFTTVSVNVEQELVSLKKELAEKSIDDRTDRKKMEEVLADAPGLAKRNEAIRGHMKACLELVKMIRERVLDEYYRISNTRNASYEEIIDLISKGTQLDALRLCISIKDRLSIDNLQEILKLRNIPKKVLEWPVFQDNRIQPDQGMRQRMFTSIVGNVKKLLPVNSETLIFSRIESIFNNIRSARDLLSLYTIYDPVFQKKQFYDSEIDRIVVFVMGAGNFEEYNSLSRLQKNLNLEIIYGSDDILSCDDFVSLLCEKYDTKLDQRN